MSVFHRVNHREERTLTWNKIYGTDHAPDTYSGKRVNEETALKFSVVWAAATLITDAVAYLTPEAFTVAEDGQTKIVQTPRWVLRPHAELRRGDVWAQLLLSALLWGNGYAMIVRRDSDGQIIGLIPLDPRNVHCEWAPGSHKRRYHLGGTPAEQWLYSGDILHIMGPAMPGAATGMSVVGQAREAIALGLTLEEFGARYFGQGSMAKVVIKHPGTLKEAQALALVKTYERFHKGAGNWHRPAVLSGGAELENISIPPDDAQFLQSREFQALDVARWFRVPPHRVGIMTKQSSWGSGLAEENMAMVQHTFRPWIRTLEDVFTAYLPYGEDAGVRVRLRDDELLRGTFKEQGEAWSTLVEKRVATPNEARKALGLPPIEGGDELAEPPTPFGDQGGGGADPKAKAGKPAQRFNQNHDTKGRFSTADGLPVAGSMADLTPEQQAMVDANMEQYGLTQQALVDEIDSRLTDDLIAEGGKWYPEANAMAQQWADETGLSVEQVAGVIAATSPNTPWPQNVKIANRITHEHGDYAGMDSRVAAEKMGGGLYNNLAHGFNITNGKAVSDEVTGTKVRSFYSNIVNPTGNHVTVDTWMLQSFMNASPKARALGGSKSAIKMSTQFRDGVGLPRELGKKGSLQPGYVSIADAVRMVAAKRGLPPATVQAAYWLYAKTTRTGGRKPRGAQVN